MTDYIKLFSELKGWHACQPKHEFKNTTVEMVIESLDLWLEFFTAAEDVITACYQDGTACIPWAEIEALQDVRDKLRGKDE